MSLTFRFARPDELEAVVRLTCHSFPGIGRGPDFWMEQFSETVYGDGPEILWVGEDAGRLVASCQLHRMVHWISGEEAPSMGLGTVTIAPTHRQRGIAGRMVETGLHAARERGDIVSSLFPFRASFYGRFGYGLAGEAHQYHVPPAAFPPSDQRSAVEVIDGAEGVAEVAELYGRWARSQTGQVKRTPRGWRDLAGGVDRLLVGYRDDGGSLSGYVLAGYPMHLPPAERYLSVEELVWVTPQARRGIYGWLASLADQWHAVAFRALPEHRTENWLQEPRLGGIQVPRWGIWFPSATILRGPMFRLVDVARAWRSRKVDAAARLTLALDVQDDQLPANGGRWRFRLESGGIDVERAEGGAEVALRLGIQTLGRIYMGALSPSAAVEASLAEVDRPDRLDLLDRALRLPQPWTFDRY